MIVRPSRDEIFMRMAELVSKRSTCGRKQVGAVIMDSKTNRVLAIGYNGSIKGAKHCTNDGACLEHGHCVRAEHAEINALACLDQSYEELTLYCTDMTCLRCLRLCLKFNVKAIVFRRWYEDTKRDELLLNGDHDIYLHQYVTSDDFFRPKLSKLIFDADHGKILTDRKNLIDMEVK